jgi:Ca2+-dependent lipid-binding protein
MGHLRVELLDGNEIRGVDRGGKSDPYAVFTLNGQKVFKSSTKKKTLTPVWKEVFECDVVRFL